MSEHKAAVRRIARWLQWSKGCKVVMAELKTQNQETPDVIGWHGHGASIMVECKVSLRRFLGRPGQGLPPM